MIPAGKMILISKAHHCHILINWIRPAEIQNLINSSPWLIEEKAIRGETLAQMRMLPLSWDGKVSLSMRPLGKSIQGKLLEVHQGALETSSWAWNKSYPQISHKPIGYDSRYVQPLDGLFGASEARPSLQCRH